MVTQKIFDTISVERGRFLCMYTAINKKKLMYLIQSQKKMFSVEKFINTINNAKLRIFNDESKERKKIENILSYKRCIMNKIYIIIKIMCFMNH